MEEKQAKILPVTPLRDAPVFPRTETVLVFGRAKSVTALQTAWESDKLFFVVMQQDAENPDTQPEDLYSVGTICQIRHILQTDGEMSASVIGLSRARVENFRNMDGFLGAEVSEIPEVVDNEEETLALANHIVSEFQNAVRMGKPFDFLVAMRIMSGVTPAELSDQLVSMLNITSKQRQELLEEPRVRTRLEKILNYLASEIKLLELERKIASQAQSKIDKKIRENVLMERKRAIEEELGEGPEDESSREVKELKTRAAKMKMPDDVRLKVDKEIKRLAQMSNLNPEYNYIRTYLDWLLEMPWDISSPNNKEIDQARKILNEDHFGLEKAKERILEYLAVMRLKHENMKNMPRRTADNPAEEAEAAKSELPVERQEVTKSNVAPTILCFVGPPGVGKTSIGKSIAKSLGRKFVRISLGGIRDEAEIRGHRRTYVGAMPGRIIQGIKQAGTKNPVFMLDEIDKIGTDFRGDPSAALLEALDPEQNHAFSDHYLEVSFDLSDVIFITTANVLDTIPPALRDRLEIVEFPGYTSEEKFHIAIDYLIPKQIEANGLQNYQVKLTREATHTIIQRYTREAGVRNLEREIAKVLRKIAREAVEKKKESFNVTVQKVQKYLGPYRFTETMAEKEDEIGMSTGLFWTPVGGGILYIEVALMPGKGALTLTGQLGEVMQESAKAALSYIRSRYRELGLDEKFFQKIDIHIHVPEGAVPKDGPSAGIAITTALASALTKIPVRKFVGMTGEITLRGRVLEIGGIKEKIIAAHRAGLKTVIMPKENKKDLEEIPRYVLRDMEFVYAEHMDEVLNIALAKSLPKQKRPLRPVYPTLQLTES